jgi:hypothetical protein
MSNRRRQLRQAEREAALRAAAETANALAKSAIASIQQGETPSQQEANDNKNKGWKFFGMNTEQWITAAAVGGCSIIYNRVSPSAYSVYFAVTTISIWLCWVTWKSWWFSRFCIWTICLVALFSTHKFVSVINPTDPILTVDVVPNHLLKDPFGNSFILENHGPGSIYHVSHAAWWNDPNGRGKRMFHGFEMTNELAELRPSVKQQLFIDPDNIHAPISPFTRLDIAVRYALENLKKRTNYYQFRAVPTDNGCSWVPYGEGDPMENALKRIPQFPPATRASDTNPVIEMRFISLLETNNDSYPDSRVELKISLENTGGVSAEHITGEWAIVGVGKDDIVRLFTKKSDIGLKERRLDPGAVSSNACNFSHEMTNFYGGILCGSNLLVGKLHYQSGGGRKFEKGFQIGEENGHLEIKAVDEKMTDFDTFR